MTDQDTQHGGEVAQDPLEGADVGETRTVRRSKTLYGMDMEPMEFFGGDRQQDVRIADVEVVEDERDGYCDDVRITWEADLTKTLPRNWDRCNEPRTADEERQERRWKWIGRGLKAAGILLPFAGAAWIATYLTNATLAGMTIDGEPVQPVGVEAALPVMALAVLLVVYIGLLTADTFARGIRAVIGR